MSDVSSPAAGTGRADSAGHPGVRKTGRQGAALHYDVAARIAIDLATGILMEQRGIGADEAMALLEHMSDRITVASVAEGVVELQADNSVAAGRSSKHHDEAVTAPAVEAVAGTTHTS
jgi:hypothetical protein